MIKNGKLISNDSVEIGYGGSKCRGSIRFSGTLEEVNGYINSHEVDLSCSGSDTEAEETNEPKVTAKRGLTKTKQSTRDEQIEAESSQSDSEDVNLAKKSKITPTPRRNATHCSQEPLLLSSRPLRDRTNNFNNTTQPSTSTQLEEFNSQSNNSTQPTESTLTISEINNTPRNQLSHEAILVLLQTYNLNM